MTRTCRFIGLFFLAAAFAAASCASGDRTLDAVDPQAVSQNPTYDQVFAIIHNRCVSCHGDGGGESGDDDNGGDYLRVSVIADTPAFETCTQIVAESETILERVEDNTMPPGAMPRLSSADKIIIRRWVENGTPSPCTVP